MIFELLKAIKDTLNEALKNMFMREAGQSSNLSKVSVYIGTFSDEKPRELSEYPFVALKPGYANLTDEGMEAEVKITCGSYVAGRPTDAGINEITNLTFRIMKSLSEKRVIGSRFEVVLPIEVHHYVPSAKPYCLAELSTRWQIPGAFSFEPDKDEMYGSGYDVEQ